MATREVKEGLTFLDASIQFTAAVKAVQHKFLNQKELEYMTPVILKPNISHKMGQSNQFDENLSHLEDHS